MKKIFISYKRNSPDEAVALQVFETLRQEHEVFIDRLITVGTDWAECIETELKRADFMISFLSSASAHSEMVLGEIEMAHRLAKDRNGAPAILPVRLAFKEPFPYQLGSILSRLQWVEWEGETDTPRLIEELKQVISGKGIVFKKNIISLPKPDNLPAPLPAAQPVNLEMPEGNVSNPIPMPEKKIDYAVSNLSFSPNGKSLAVSHDNKIDIFTSDQEKPLTLEVNNDNDVISAIAWSEDGAYLAAAKGGEAIVWQVDIIEKKSKEFIRVFHEPTRQIKIVDLFFVSDQTADSRYLTTVGREGIVNKRLWKPDDLIKDACERIFSYDNAKTESLKKDWKNLIGEGEDNPFPGVCKSYESK